MNRTILRNFSKLLVITLWSAAWGGACTSPSYTIPTPSSSVASSAGKTSGGASGGASAGQTSELGGGPDGTIAPGAGAGGDTYAGAAGVGGFDPVTTPFDCGGDGDCASLRAARVCDIVSQTCVQCLPGRTSCGVGLYCGTDKECHVGCATNADCLTGNCDSAQNRCTGCKTGSDCSAGTRCDVTTGTCVPSCEDASHCPSGWVCCTGVCANLDLDEANCNSCGTSCVRANADATCSETGCHLLECKSGYADCNGKLSDGCEVEVSSNPSNCGTCGNICPSHLVCKSGSCVAPDCGAGYQNCDARSENGCETNVLRDILNCSACSSPCSTANGKPSCEAGVCQMTCDSGWGDCDGNPLNGCESEYANDPKHCGRCSAPCTNVHGETACVANRCTPTCQNGYGDCDGVPSNGCETDVLADANNCSSCGKPCKLANASANCTSGQCTIASCANGWADCNGKPEDGCEINVLTDVDNCSQCGTACSKANGTASCNQGSCVIECAANFGNCATGNDGCETDLTASLSHCGTCGNACTAPTNATALCTTSGCSFKCTTGFDNCNSQPGDGCESSLSTDAKHCGKCNNACVAGCTGGVCDTPCTGKACPSIRKVVRPPSGNFKDTFGTASVCYEASGLPVAGGRTNEHTGGTVLINSTSVASNTNWPISLPPVVAGGYCVQVSGGSSSFANVEIWFNP